MDREAVGARNQRHEVEAVSWNRMDDDFSDHPKVVAAGNSAVGCWVRCWATCGRYRTGGFVSSAIAARYGTRQDHHALTEARLWFAVHAGGSYTVTGRRDSGRRRLRDVTVTFPSDGYFIRDFLHFHFTREESDGGGPRATVRDNSFSNSAPLEARAKPAPLEERAKPAPVGGARNLPSHPSTETPLYSEGVRTPAPPVGHQTHPEPDPEGVVSQREADPDPDGIRAVAARLSDIGWRSKTRADRGEGAWLRNVEKLVHERGLHVEAVDRLWAKAQAKGKDPIAMLDKWLPTWRDVLADEDLEKRVAKRKADGVEQQRAAQQDVHHHTNGNFKSPKDVGPVFGEPTA